MPEKQPRSWKRSRSDLAGGAFAAGSGPTEVRRLDRSAVGTSAPLSLPKLRSESFSGRGLRRAEASVSRRRGPAGAESLSTNCPAVRAVETRIALRVQTVTPRRRRPVRPFRIGRPGEEGPRRAVDGRGARASCGHAPPPELHAAGRPAPRAIPATISPRIRSAWVPLLTPVFAESVVLDNLRSGTRPPHAPQRSFASVARQAPCDRLCRAVYPALARSGRSGCTPPPCRKKGRRDGPAQPWRGLRPGATRGASSGVLATPTSATRRNARSRPNTAARIGVAGASSAAPFNTSSQGSRWAGPQARCLSGCRSSRVSSFLLRAPRASTRTLGRAAMRTHAVGQ